MRSRINSTGRVKIRREAFKASFFEGGDGTKVDFEVDLADMNLLPDGLIIIEAYRQSVLQRFDFGTVGMPGLQADAYLNELEPDQASFRVKVVEPGTGRLLARGDRFSAQLDQIDREELLPVRSRDLGAEPWKTEIGAGGRPILVLNDKIPDALGRLNTDAVFKALILPAALRQVLWLLSSSNPTEGDDDEAEWETQWLRFCRAVGGEDAPDFDDIPAVQTWIDSVCAAFSKQHPLLDGLVQGG